MSQIHTQGSHFWRLLVTVDFDDGFNKKICSVDHIIIVVYISFGMSLSVTMISARDASTSEKILNILYNRCAGLICTL